MSEADPFAPIDPLEALPAPERVNYATGVLLAAEDFRDEQSYHRARLATALRALVGHGTLAGLRVEAPAADDPERELRVAPGVAVDRYGRLVELTEPWCIRLARWFSVQDDQTLKAANQGGATPVMFVDVFLAAEACARGKTPAFATGPFDALDAVVPARIAETAALELVIRTEAGTPPLPRNFWPAANASAANKLAAVLDSWHSARAVGTDTVLEPLQEHVEPHDPSAIWLARAAIPLTVPPDPPNARPRLDLLNPVTVDNAPRPFVFLPGKWLGSAFAVAPDA